MLSFTRSLCRLTHHHYRFTKSHVIHTSASPFIDTSISSLTVPRQPLIIAKRGLQSIASRSLFDDRPKDPLVWDMRVMTHALATHCTNVRRDKDYRYASQRVIVFGSQPIAEVYYVSFSRALSLSLCLSLRTLCLYSFFITFN